jgi:hypothetical protein
MCQHNLLTLHNCAVLLLLEKQLFPQDLRCGESVLVAIGMLAVTTGV